MAVRVRGGSKSYGSGAGSNMVLNKLDMDVPAGVIYGLLGSSGCGKTTILSCIAGRLRLDSGQISVLGGVPGSRGSGVPGPRIGYMPQETALVAEMSAKETIYYFGWLAGMRSEHIEARFRFLSSLLELPPAGKLVKHMSGGQQRRVSFAAALVQTPELLILDEPTVGLDPVLRQSIWDYLVEITRHKHMSIIITTHYIEEATQAHKIGLLRGGRLLAETAPDALIASYGCQSLEQVYLLLSQRQQDNVSVLGREDDPVHDNMEASQSSRDGSQDGSQSSSQAMEDDWQQTQPEPRELSTAPRKQQHQSSFAFRMKALLFKNAISILRNKAGVAFVFLVPILEVVFFFLAVGLEADGIPLAIVNDEVTSCGTQQAVPGPGAWLDGADTCRYRTLSCLFVHLLEDTAVHKVHFPDLASAMASSRRTTNQGVVRFPANFSQLVQERHQDGSQVSNETLEAANIDVHLDMSNFVVGYQTKKLLWDTTLRMFEEIATACNYSRRQFVVPVNISSPVFQQQSMRTFMAPAILVSIVFFLNALGTATLITNERQHGLWDRNLIAGARVAEAVLACVLSAALGLLIQVAEIALLSFLGFQLPCLGSLATATSLLVLQAFAGVTFGLLISACCRDMTTACYVTLATFLPYSLVVGALWPVQGQPPGLRALSYLTPGTLPAQALLSVLTRGLGLDNVIVYTGFGVTALYIVGSYLVAVLVLSKDSRG